MSWHLSPEWPHQSVSVTCVFARRSCMCLLWGTHSEELCFEQRVGKGAGMRIVLRRVGATEEAEVTLPGAHGAPVVVGVVGVLHPPLLRGQVCASAP